MFLSSDVQQSESTIHTCICTLFENFPRVDHYTVLSSVSVPHSRSLLAIYFIYSSICQSCSTVHASSVMSDSLQPRGPIRLLCPWTFLGKNTGVCCHFLLQGIFPIQGSNPSLLRLLRRQADSLPPCHLESPYVSPSLPIYPSEGL